ncbi:MAG: Uncharacterised protein [Synechococcus sp. CC9902]|nr:MAG: Uncharacterised protein [Synechococcus sp. CC9902]
MEFLRQRQPVGAAITLTSTLDEILSQQLLDVVVGP